MEFVTSEAGYFFATILVGLGGTLWVKAKRGLDNLKKLYSITHLVETDIAVYTHLSELMISTGAVRAFVFQFHNGVFYVNTSNQMKMSCTHEVTKEGISKECKNMQDMLLSQTPISVSEIVKSESYRIDTNTDSDCNFHHLLRSQGIHLAIFSKITNKDNIEGFLGIGYWDGQSISSMDFDENVATDLVKDRADKIGFLLRGKK